MSNLVNIQLSNDTAIEGKVENFTMLQGSFIGINQGDVLQLPSDGGSIQVKAQGESIHGYFEVAYTGMGLWRVNFRFTAYDNGVDALKVAGGDQIKAHSESSLGGSTVTGHVRFSY